MTTTTSEIRIAAAPRFAGMQSWTCTYCGAEELARPVFLTDGRTTFAAGTGCAAKALGYSRTVERVSARVEREMRAEMHRLAGIEEIRSELRTAAAALAEFAGSRDDTAGATPNLDRMRRNFWSAVRSGRLPEGSLLVPDIEGVAVTGES